MHWFIDPIKYHYADFDGRASRQEYWMFQLMMFIILFFGSMFLAITSSMLLVSLRSEGAVLPLALMALIVVFVLGTIVPSIALQVRRLHDIGRSGWWIFLGLVPYIGGLVLLIFYCLPSQQGVNRYGSNPNGVSNGVVPRPPQAPELTPEQQDQVMR